MSCNLKDFCPLTLARTNRTPLFESMGGITLRTSQLDPDVPVSVHPAPDLVRV